MIGVYLISLSHHDWLESLISQFWCTVLGYYTFISAPSLTDIIYGLRIESQTSASAYFLHPTSADHFYHLRHFLLIAILPSMDISTARSTASFQAVQVSRAFLRIQDIFGCTYPIVAIERSRDATTDDSSNLASIA